MSETPYSDRQQGLASSSSHKRPWLPRKHVLGLIAVAVFIVGSFSWLGVTLAVGWDPEQILAQRQLLEKQEEGTIAEGDLFDQMTRAMLNDDREAFIEQGEGEGREQLAQIWDGTKSVGWTVGSTQQVYGGLYPSDAEDTAREPVPENDDLFDVPDPEGLDFAFDLGFTSTQVDTVYPDMSDEEAAEARERKDPILEGEEQEFIMTQQFRYAITVTGSITDDTMRITSLTPLAEQPWDHPDGVAVAKRDNVALYGFASDAAAIEAAADDAQVAASGLLADQAAMFPRVNYPGFSVFFTTDNERFLNAAYGDQPQARAERRGGEAGLTKRFSSFPINMIAQNEGQVYAGGGVPGVLLLLNQSTPDSVLRTSVHEMAHALHSTGQEGSWSALTGTNSPERTFGVEGYATAVEDKIAGQIDGLRKSREPHVREAIMASTNPEDLVDGEAFENPETAGLAYAVAGNYMTFLAQSDEGTFQTEIGTGGYELFPFVLWVEGLRSTNGADLSVMAWKQWNAEER